ncbi:MAG: Uma2 family endonuclease [Myxococcales bacterium]|nr:Uma2 family endonuclease [Myxococcales bacterium]
MVCCTPWRPLDSVGVARRHITRDEYLRMAEVGILRDDERVELLRGEVVVMSPIGLAHARVVSVLVRILVRQLGGDWLVQPQGPLRMWTDSMPEPDLAVVPTGSFTQFADRCALVIEVADSSLHKDLRIKAPLYAEAAIPVYWLVDLTAREVLVMTDPVDGVYQRVDRARPGDVLTLAGQPDVAVPVAEIVPPG